MLLVEVRFLEDRRAPLPLAGGDRPVPPQRISCAHLSGDSSEATHAHRRGGVEQEEGVAVSGVVVDPVQCPEPCGIDGGLEILQHWRMLLHLRPPYLLHLLMHLVVLAEAHGRLPRTTPQLAAKGKGPSRGVSDCSHARGELMKLAKT